MLVALEAGGPLRVVDLAHALGVDSSSIGRMCDRLERRGVLVRHRASGDRRIVLVSLSGTGPRTVARATSARRAAIRSALAQLGDHQQRAAVSALWVASRVCDQMSRRE
jgi:DNA-binding MarR family transcriptional regulator